MSLLTVLRILHLWHTPMVAGLVVLGVAEWLILGKRFFASGLEEALEVIGLLLIAVDRVNVPGELQIGLLAGAVFVASGLKLLTPLFTTLGAIALSIAFDARTLLSGPGFEYARHVPASLFCFAVAALALGLGSLPFRRPSHDRMLDWLVVALPGVGYLWAAESHVFGAPVDYLHHPALIQLVAPLAPLTFGIAAVASGIRRRTHAPLLAFMLCVVCTAYELRGVSGLPLETRMIVWGLTAFVVAGALSRWLRTARGAITSQALRDDTGSASLVEMAGAVAIAPNVRPASPSQAFEGAGGQFGGGGASGRW
jgi:hypothetical protein